MPKLQDYPAEGSREVINRELARTQPQNPAIVDREEVSRLLGELDPAAVAEILALRPSLSDLEQASAWLAGEGDVPAQQGHPLMGKAAAIVDLARRDSDDSEFH
jgi:hypothetical protein